MDNFIKNIKKKLSVDNLVDIMKDSKVIDESTIKEEDVRNTLQKLDPNSVMDVDEIHAKLNELSEEVSKSKSKTETSTTSTSKRIIDVAKSSIGALGTTAKKEEEPEKNPNENEYLKALGREENVFNLYDDFH
ncbi:uncharacterized protein LOC135086755 [Ostrinia nubilalis]|uniref:uncharacterized protein LOC114365040 n=1 Tax=Ostrinia furnacalis TaxID=93504 RepID=UPI00103CB8C7|nr:uncharacterized protein LOC114365040 [Ostrinia furnacalis]